MVGRRVGGEGGGGGHEALAAAEQPREERERPGLQRAVGPALRLGARARPEEVALQLVQRLAHQHVQPDPPVIAGASD